MTQAYEEAYRESLENPEEFWGRHAEECFWYKKWDKVLDDSNKPFYRWFTGGVTNTCYNALDMHVERGAGDRVALIYDSPVTNTIKKYTYRELRDEVALFAGVLAEHGVEKGDRVVLYMPMIAEAAIAMLACARLGAVHSVVFGGFAANELATRINDAGPKVIVSASCGIEGKKVIPYKPLLDAAIEISEHKPPKLHYSAKAHGKRRDASLPGRGLDSGHGKSLPQGLRARPGHGSPVHPVHFRHDRPAQRRGAG